ncbi:MAG: DNA polymerase III delta prime subunit [Brockia lithotrophica]|uniref:DNA polymerase III delta prime subunit n=1 Tax=Brockia lithotrophica TaxID=933949 RepID=A0A2T5G562_9BACL|nr:hypothetical protein [Brockia lithotrophica]PTQ51332.1 MAG: DNA polymerase III delta prime subunit [Brockia lithotrophica]
MHRVERFLRSALQRGRLAHAYALYGPFLEEKRDVALRVAAAYLAADTGESEEELAARVARGGEVDRVYAAAREGKLRMDDVRGLRDFLALAPPRGRRRVVWVELREPPLPEAQNALLKLLEEPPTGTLFFLAARSPEGLLPTVRSRLLPLVFPLPPYERRKEIYVRRGFSSEAAAALAVLGDVEDLGGLAPEDLVSLLREVAAFVCAPPPSAGERLLWAERVLGQYGKEGAVFALAYAVLLLGELLRQSVGVSGESALSELGVSLASCGSTRSRADLYASLEMVIAKFRTYSATRTALAFKAALVGLK